MGDVFAAADERRAEKRVVGRKKRCHTCNHDGVMASLQEYFDGVEAGREPLGTDELYYALKRLHPNWRATSPSTLNNHLRLGHEPRWSRARD